MNILTQTDPGHRVAGMIDVETTGLNPFQDEVVELSLVLFAFEPESGAIRGIVDQYTGLREPGCPISAGAGRVHGLTVRALRGHRLDDLKILALIERAEFLIAHNASFDYHFVRRLYPQVEAKRWYCSMNGIPWREKGFTSRGLQALLHDHRIRVDKAHRAGADVEACLTLLARMNGDGVSYLLELLKGRSFRG